MLSKTICLCTNGLRLKETRALPTGVISWNSRHAPQSIRSYVSETHPLLTVSVSQTTQTVSSYASNSTFIRLWSFKNQTSLLCARYNHGASFPRPWKPPTVDTSMSSPDARALSCSDSNQYYKVELHSGLVFWHVPLQPLPHLHQVPFTLIEEKRTLNSFGGIRNSLNSDVKTRRWERGVQNKYYKHLSVEDMRLSDIKLSNCSCR
ncbi:hypothetical protein YC2023_025053 [Brassica napus]